MARLTSHATGTRVEVKGIPDGTLIWDDAGNVSNTSGEIVFTVPATVMNGDTLTVTTTTGSGDWYWSVEPEPAGTIIDRYARDLARRFPA